MYRLGQYEAALATLKRSIEQEDTGEAELFLAMTHWQLGNQQEARAAYDTATEVQAADTAPTRSGYFAGEAIPARFAEARELLGIPADEQ